MSNSEFNNIYVIKFEWHNSAFQYPVQRIILLENKWGYFSIQTMVGEQCQIQMTAKCSHTKG